MLSGDMECNVREAQDKIMTAYRIKEQYPVEAEWYRDMARAHLEFNRNAHALISDRITEYKNSKEHAEHPEYAAGMMAVWEDKHADIVDDTARVRSMIDEFK